MDIKNNNNKEPLGIILVDDHDSTREYLAELILQKTQWRILGEVASGKAAVELAHRTPPDVVVMDVRMPEMNGIEATRKITAMHPHTRVIMLSNCTDSIMVHAAIQAGANAYVAKQRAGEELIPGICAAMDGDQFIGSLINF